MSGDRLSKLHAGLQRAVPAAAQGIRGQLASTAANWSCYCWDMPVQTQISKLLLMRVCLHLLAVLCDCTHVVVPARRRTFPQHHQTA